MRAGEDSGGDAAMANAGAAMQVGSFTGALLFWALAGPAAAWGTL